MTLLIKPARGGFLRPFGCGWFIREFLLGNSPYGSPSIDPDTGAPQADIFYHYKMALRQATAVDKATRMEERRAKKEKRLINPERIEDLIRKYLTALPYKSHGCTFHSFVVYFSNLQRLKWVEATGFIEPSSFQDNYSKGQPRKYFRLTKAGIYASDSDWANPQTTLYGYR